MQAPVDLKDRIKAPESTPKEILAKANAIPKVGAKVAEKAPEAPLEV